MKKLIMAKHMEGQINLSNIAGLEKNLQIKLPKEYVNFIKSYNGSRPLQNRFPLKEPAQYKTIEYTAAIDFCYKINGDETTNLVNKYNYFCSTITGTKDLLPIVNCGNAEVFMSFKEEHYGKLFYWKYTSWDSKNYDGTLYLIADNFSIFIDSLFQLDIEFDSNNQILKRLNIHDRYSLPYSTHVKKFGSKVLDFFKKAPPNIEDFVMEDIEVTKDVILYYDVSPKNKRYIRHLSQHGEILEEKVEDLP